MPGTRQPLGAFGWARDAPDLDVTRAAQIQGAVKKNEFLDILINNAGVAIYDDLSNLDVIEQHLAVNLWDRSVDPRFFAVASTLPWVLLSTTCHWWRLLPCRSQR